MCYVLLIIFSLFLLCTQLATALVFDLTWRIPRLIVIFLCKFMVDIAHRALILSECEIERMLLLSFFMKIISVSGKNPKINWEKIQSYQYHEITDVFARNPYRNPPIFAINPVIFAISDHRIFRSKQVNLKHPLCKRKPPVPVSHTLQLESSLKNVLLRK